MTVTSPKPVDVSDVIDLKACGLMVLSGIARKQIKYGNTGRTLRELNALIQFMQEARGSDQLLSMLSQPAVPAQPSVDPSIVSILSKINDRLVALEAK